MSPATTAIPTRAQSNPQEARNASTATNAPTKVINPIGDDAFTHTNTAKPSMNSVTRTKVILPALTLTEPNFRPKMKILPLGLRTTSCWPSLPPSLRPAGKLPDLDERLVNSFLVQRTSFDGFGWDYFLNFG